MRPKSFLAVILLTASFGSAWAEGTADLAPDVLILGDSQLTFGAAEAFLDELGALAGKCGLDADATTGIIGVRSSAITSWTGTTKSAKRAICDIDPKWNVNAGAYGTLSQGKNPYIQIGKGVQFQFCRPGMSPLEALFADGYYAPDLVIFFMMGNAADRWAGDPAAALQDVRALMANLSPDQPCIFMTSAPPYKEKAVKKRQQAQENIKAAFARAGGRCTFVPGLTAETIAENQGNAANFRRNGSGKVKDPNHPTEAAARRFLALRRATLCNAIGLQLTGR